MREANPRESRKKKLTRNFYKEVEHLLSDESKKSLLDYIETL